MSANSNLQVGTYGTVYRSIYSDVYPPEFYKKYFQRYNKGFKTFDMLHLAGNTFTVRNRKFSHMEEQLYDRLATIGSGGIATSAAGVNVTFHLLSTDYDATGAGPLRKDDTIIIPKANLQTGATMDAVYHITTVGTEGGASTTYTAKPYSTTSAIQVAITSGTGLIIGATRYAPGTGQPAGKTVGPLVYDHYLSISKESKEMEGGHQSYRDYREEMGGFNSQSTQRLELEYALDCQINSKLLISETNANAITQLGRNSVTKTIVSGLGYLNCLDAYAQDMPWNNSTFADTDFDTMNALAETQGNINGNLWLNAGTNLYNAIEKGILSYVATNSGGTDLMTRLGEVGVTFTKFTRGGYTYTITKSGDFTNPNGFGASAYKYKNMGFVVPLGDTIVSINDSKIAVPNLGIAYLAGNGEDRTRIIADKAGMNGLGIPVSDEYDDSCIWALSESGLFAANVNQHIWIQGS